MSEDLTNTPAADKIEKFINSEVGQKIEVVLSYSIKTTNTTTDDEILQNAEEISKILTESLAKIANRNPSETQAKKAIIDILKWIAARTPNKWDDALVKLLDIFY